MSGDKNIGKILRDLRVKKGMASKDLADAIKMSPAYYSKIENGHVKLTDDVLSTIAKYYGVSKDDIVKGRAEPAKAASAQKSAKPAEKKATAKPAEKKPAAKPAEKKPEAKPAEKKQETKPAPAAAHKEEPKAEAQHSHEAHVEHTHAPAHTQEHTHAHTQEHAHAQEHDHAHVKTVAVDTAPYSEIRDRARREGPTMPKDQKEEIAAILRRALKDIEA